MVNQPVNYVLDKDRLSARVIIFAFYRLQSIDEFINSIRVDIREDARRAILDGDLFSEELWAIQTAIATALRQKDWGQVLHAARKKPSWEEATLLVACEFCLQQGKSSDTTFQFLQYIHLNHSRKLQTRPGLFASAARAQLPSINTISDAAQVFQQWEKTRMIG